MLKLKRKLIFAAIIGITAFMSCEKNNNDLSEIESLEVVHVDNFTVTFNHDGDFVTNDDEFVKSNPLIYNALSQINANFISLKSTGNISFTINHEGKIISEDACYNGRRFAEVLINEGGLNYFDQDFTVFYDNSGFKSISNEDIFLQHPELKQGFIDAGEYYKGNVPDNKEISIFFKGNKFFVNGKEFPLFSNLKSTKGEKYEYFKDCVGYWWMMIGINIPACGVAVIIEFW